MAESIVGAGGAVCGGSAPIASTAGSSSSNGWQNADGSEVDASLKIGQGGAMCGGAAEIAE